MSDPRIEESCDDTRRTIPRTIEEARREFPEAIAFSLDPVHGWEPSKVESLPSWWQRIKEWFGA